MKLKEIIVNGASARMANRCKGVRYVYLPLLFVSGLFGPAGASAQSGAIEEVVVTAQKREQNLQSIGVSVSAFDQAAMKEAGIDDISRVELVTPGVTYAFIGSDAKINIRGANSDNTYGDHASIAGAFMDGVYLPRAAQQKLGYFDVARLEVLKGPQGTLYGRNTFAGAINIYSNLPDLDGFDAGVDITASRFSRLRQDAFVNLPVSDTFALRFAGATEKADGWVKNVGEGSDLGSEDQKHFRISSLWEASDSVSVIARYTSLSESGTPMGVFGNELLCIPTNASGLTDPLGTFSNCGEGEGGLGVDPRAETPWEVNYAGNQIKQVDSDNFTLQVDWDLDFATLRSISSYTDFVSLYDSASGGSPNIGLSYTTFDESANSITQELVLTSNGDGPLGWVAGAYYSEDEVLTGFGFVSTASFDRLSEVGFDALGNAHIRRHPTALINPFGGANFSEYIEFQEVETTTTGLFTQLEWSLTDSLKLIGGIRYNKEKKAARVGFDTTGLSSADAPYGFRQDAGYGRPLESFSFSADGLGQNETFEKTTWKAGFEWALADGNLVYASASTGFLSGGLNSDGSSFEQQNSQAIEFGYKSRWLEDTLQFNVAIYQNDYEDLTTQVLRDLNSDGVPDATVSLNSGDIATTGLEVELVWLPAENWTLKSQMSFIDNEYGEFAVLNPFQLYNGIPASQVNGGAIDLSGETPPWSPDVTLGLSAAYDIDLGDRGIVTPYLQVYYSDGYGTDDRPVYQAQFQESYTKTDFRVNWSSADDRWGLSVFVENIEDEAVLARTQTNGPVAGLVTNYAYPRNYGMSFSYRF